MQTKPEIDPKKYYRQAEAARLLGVDYHTLARKARDPRSGLEPHTVAGFSGKFYLGRQLLALVKVT